MLFFLVTAVRNLILISSETSLVSHKDIWANIKVDITHYSRRRQNLKFLIVS
jgi:hypothetical protein